MIGVVLTQSNANAHSLTRRQQSEYSLHVVPCAKLSPYSTNIQKNRSEVFRCPSLMLIDFLASDQAAELKWKLKCDTWPDRLP